VGLVVSAVRRMVMRTPDQLQPEELRDIVSQIQVLLWLNYGPTGDFWDGDKEWDTETLEYVSRVLEDYGLRPGMPQMEVDSFFVV
jgi:hypothetical protein